MRVFFIGDSFRADAQTWLKGLRTYGNAEIQVWELPKVVPGFAAKVSRTLQWAKGIFLLRKAIKDFNADIVIAYRVTSYGFLAAKAGRHPVVVAQQGITDVWPPNAMSTPMKAALGRYALKHADLIHAWGEVMVPAMLELGADPDKIMVMPKGVDRDVFNYKLETKPTDKIVGIVTRSLYPDYRHEVILDAIKMLKDKGLPIEVYMIGDGDLRQDLERKTKELGLEKEIHWEGRISHHDLPSYLQRANIYISMPVTEGVSSSLFEAMATGCVPVISDLPGTRIFINQGENGYLVPVDDAAALAEHIQKAWSDKQWMGQAREKNKQFIEEYATYQKNMPRFIEKYRELIARERSKKK